MKLRIDSTDSTVVKDNETYKVIDNTVLDNLVVSKTILHPRKETRGHCHPGQEEVYHFVHGCGTITIDAITYGVRAGDVVVIPDGAFHKVHNSSSLENLTFVCVFDGKRSH